MLVFGGNGCNRGSCVMPCDSYYGNGGQYVKAAIEAINDREKDGYITIYHKMSDTFSISQEEADEIDAYWELAEKACEGTGALKAVVRSELSWRYVKAMLHLSEFSGTKEARRAEKEKLYNEGLFEFDIALQYRQFC